MCDWCKQNNIPVCAACGEYKHEMAHTEMRGCECGICMGACKNCRISGCGMCNGCKKAGIPVCEECMNIYKNDLVEMNGMVENTTNYTGILSCVFMFLIAYIYVYNINLNEKTVFMLIFLFFVAYLMLKN
jgi:hypothetical protein